MENVGQFDAAARFQVRGAAGSTLWLAQNELWLTAIEPLTQPDPTLLDPTLPPPEPPIRAGVNVRLTFPDANPTPTLQPFNRLSSKVSYLIGSDPAAWQADVPVWGGVRYVDLYPGVDLEITSQGQELVQRFVVKQTGSVDTIQNTQMTANAAAWPDIRVKVEGANHLSLDRSRMMMQTNIGLVIWPLWQLETESGQPLDLPASPTLTGSEISAPFSRPDSTFYLPLIINQSGSSPSATTLSLSLLPQAGGSDPAYGAFVGGGGNAIAVDDLGQAYVAGQVLSTHFPVTPGAFNTNPDDGYVLKLSADGSRLVYATYLGGSDADGLSDIVIDGDGNAYLTGRTHSTDFIPAGVSGYDTSHNGEYDAYLVKLAADGSRLQLLAGGCTRLSAKRRSSRLYHQVWARASYARTGAR